MTERGSTRNTTLAIIVPVYNEQDVLPEFFRELNAVVDQCNLRVNVIYVDDGSTDRTAELLARESSSRRDVQVLQLSRNFGSQSALRAGLDEAQGEAVVFLDADLQDPPKLILEMIKLWQDGADVVVAQRRSRAEKGIRGIGFFLFHRIYARLMHHLIPQDSGVFGLFDRRVAEALKSCPETNLFIPGLMGWVGFRQEVVLYDRPERKAGETKQSIFRLLQHAWNAVASFSVIPLRMILVFGLCISIGSMTYGVCLLVIRVAQWFGYFLTLQTPGFTTLAVAIFFLGGIQLISIGLVGEYLARVYDECKRRPHYFIKQRLP